MSLDYAPPACIRPGARVKTILRTREILGNLIYVAPRGPRLPPIPQTALLVLQARTARARIVPSYSVTASSGDTQLISPYVFGLGLGPGLRR